MNEKKNFIVGLYPRVSTEDKSRYGHSLDEQEESMKKLCDFKGYTIYKIYREEGVSAKSMDRPKFQEMIDDLKSGKINKIIVYKLDKSLLGEYTLFLYLSSINFVVGFFISIILIFLVPPTDHF